MEAVAQIEQAQAELIVTEIVAQTEVVEARAEQAVAQAECATAQAVAETAIAEATAVQASEIVAASLPQKDDSQLWQERFDSLKAELLSAIQPQQEQLANLTTEFQAVRQTQAEQAGTLASLLTLLPPKPQAPAAEPQQAVPVSEARPENGTPSPLPPTNKGEGQRRKIRRI